jgi:signal peptidase I
MASTDSVPPGNDWPRVLWSALLSLFMPGLGQIYARSWRLGVILFSITILLMVGIRLLTRAGPPVPACLVLGMGLLAWQLVFPLCAAVDAARRMRRQHDRTRPAWFRSTWFAAIVSVALSTGLSFAVPFGWRAFSIPSGSNLPTLLVGDRIVADVRAPGIMPDRGDVVLFIYPRDPSVTYIKRLVGLPGDRIQLTNGQLSINGQPVPRQAAGAFVTDDSGIHVSVKRYIETLPNDRRYSVLQMTDNGAVDNTTEYRVPPGTFFVLGDNRDNSLDSRMTVLGNVPVRNLIGKATTVVWSPDHARIFSPVE